MRGDSLNLMMILDMENGSVHNWEVVSSQVTVVEIQLMPSIVHVMGIMLP